MSTPNDIHVHSEAVGKPCPFCGRYNIACWWKPEGWAVKCMYCDVTIEGFASRHVAISAWNRRPDVVRQERVTELERQRDQDRLEIQHLDALVVDLAGDVADLDESLVEAEREVAAAWRENERLRAALNELREAAAPFVDDGNTADCRDYVTVAVDYAEHARLLALVPEEERPA